MKTTTTEANPSETEEVAEPMFALDGSGGYPVEDSLSKYSWYSGNQPGAMALLHAAELDANPNSEIVKHKGLGRLALAFIPEQFLEYYDKQADPRAKVLEEARQDMLQTVEHNFSPEVRTQIEDLKLLASEVFGEVAAAGFLPFFDQEQFVARLAKTEFSIHGQFDKLNTGPAAFAWQERNEIGSIGLGNMLRPKTFIHEVAHIAIEANTPGYETLYVGCKSVGEATVQHLADRGYQFFRKKAFKQKEEGVHIPYTKLDKKRGMQKSEFSKYDERGVYEADRRILYELCEGDIKLQDFINALTDPSFASTLTLLKKLKEQFPNLPVYFGQAYEHSSPLSVIQTYIDGPDAEIRCGGLKERHERAEFVLKQIWLYKSKRDLEQAWTARTAAKKAYAHSRRAAVRVHSNYFS